MKRHRQEKTNDRRYIEIVMNENKRKKKKKRNSIKIKLKSFGKEECRFKKEKKRQVDEMRERACKKEQL
jgi:hypothetical protein